MVASAQNNLGLLRTFPREPRFETRRPRELGWGVLFAIGAAAAGSVLGLVASPGPRQDQTAADLAWTTAAAVQTAQRSEDRARAAEKSVSELRARLDQLDAAGAVQDLRDFLEAKRLGLDRALGDRGRLWGDDRRRVLAAIVREGRRNGLDPVMVAAVIEIESHFDPFAVSQAGAYGLMQLMPPTAQELFAGNGRLKTSYLFNPVLNIELGTAYMAQLLRRFDGDAQRALIAYNAGPSVARALVHGSKSHRRLAAYPRAVLGTYRNLLLAQQESGARLAQR